jgi:hypothetical protein
VDRLDVALAWRERHKAGSSCHGWKSSGESGLLSQPPRFTPYYTIPIAMLSLWSLLFASLMQPAEAVDDVLLGQAVKA